MKQLAILLTLATLMAACATPQALPEDLTTYEVIWDFPGQKEMALYDKANSWLVETFVSAETVIDYQNQEAGRIMGKFVTEAKQGSGVGRVRQIITVDVRDEAARIVFKDPYYRETHNSIVAALEVLGGTGDGTGQVNGRYYPVYKQKTMDQIMAEWETLAADFQKYLDTHDEWVD